MNTVLENKLKNYFKDHIETIEKTQKKMFFKILEISNIISNRFQNGNKLLICGNGGSASDSQHIATEFMSALTHDVRRKAIPAIALTTDTSFITAHTNDFSYDDVFSRQIEGLGNKGDILIGLSTSGKSKNIIRAFKTAKALDLETILFTGMYNLKRNYIDHILNVQSGSTQHIQETHITIAHIIIEIIEINLGYRKLKGT